MATVVDDNVAANITNAMLQDYNESIAVRRAASARLSEGTALIIERMRSAAQSSERRGETSAEQLSQLYGVKAAESLLSQGLSDAQLAVLGVRFLGGQPQSDAGSSGVNSGAGTGAPTKAGG